MASILELLRRLTEERVEFVLVGGIGRHRGRRRVYLLRPGEDLIASKKALGRPKDLRAVAELEVVLRRRPT